MIGTGNNVAFDGQKQIHVQIARRVRCTKHCSTRTRGSSFSSSDVLHGDTAFRNYGSYRIRAKHAQDGRSICGNRKNVKVQITNRRHITCPGAVSSSKRCASHSRELSVHYCLKHVLGCKRPHALGHGKMLWMSMDGQTECL